MLIIFSFLKEAWTGDILIDGFAFDSSRESQLIIYYNPLRILTYFFNMGAPEFFPLFYFK